MDALVLGVNGSVGRAIAMHLNRHGFRVTGTGRDVERFPRSLAEAGVGFLVSDRNDKHALAQAVGDGSDVVVDCLCYTAEHATDLLEHRDRFDSAIMISSKAVYVDDRGNHSNSDDPPDFHGPIREDQAVLAPDVSGDYHSRKGYGANKVAAERALLDADWPVSILRPSRIHGPGAIRPREWFFVRRILDGRKRIPLAHRGLTANQPTAAANIGALAAACARRPAQRVLNVADPDAPTSADMVLAVAAACGTQLDAVGLPDDAPPELGDNPWASWPPVFLDTSASLQLPDYEPVPYAVAVAEEVQWLLSLGAHERDALNADPYFIDLFDYELDDRGLAVADRSQS